MAALALFAGAGLVGHAAAPGGRARAAAVRRAGGHLSAGAAAQAAPAGPRRRLWPGRPQPLGAGGRLLLRPGGVRDAGRAGRRAMSARGSAASRRGWRQRVAAAGRTRPPRRGSRGSAPARSSSCSAPRELRARRLAGEPDRRRRATRGPTWWPSARGDRLVVQCKLLGRPVGNYAVQEVVAARSHQHANRALVASNQRFTASCIELAASQWRRAVPLERAGAALGIGGGGEMQLGQAMELPDIQLLRPPRRLDPGCRQQASGSAAEGAQAGAQHLAALAEGGAGQVGQASRAAGRRAARAAASGGPRWR